jgi:hypothetical protein
MPLFVGHLVMWPLKLWTHSAKGAHPYRKSYRSIGIKVAAPPLDLPCDGLVTYPGDIKTLRIPSKRRSSDIMSHQINVDRIST